MANKIRYTYSTDEERLKKIKIISAEENITINKIIDEAIDTWLQIKKV